LREPVADRISRIKQIEPGLEATFLKAGLNVYCLSLPSVSSH
jgi:hypothetical protein